MKVSETMRRIAWIDIMRCIAIFLVVLNHSVESVFGMTIERLAECSTVEKVFAISAFSLGRIGVPFFLIISGYLLIDREWDSGKSVYFWKNNCLRLFICTEIWWLIYDIFISAFYRVPFNVWKCMSDLIFLHKVELPHVWYMPMLLGMYMLIPFVGLALKQVEEKYVVFAFIVFFNFACVFPVISIIGSALGVELMLQISLGFSGGAYGLYMVWGYLIKKKIYNKLPCAAWGVLGVSFFVAVVTFQVLFYFNGIAYNVWYDNAILFVAAGCLFVFIMCACKQCEDNDGMPIIRCLAKDSFGIYLVHVVLIRLMRPFFLEYIMVSTIVMSLALTIAIFLLSWAVVDLFRRIPKFGIVLFYIR